MKWYNCLPSHPLNGCDLLMCSLFRLLIGSLGAAVIIIVQSHQSKRNRMVISLVIHQLEGWWKTISQVSLDKALSHQTVWACKGDHSWLEIDWTGYLFWGEAKQLHFGWTDCIALNMLQSIWMSATRLRGDSLQQGTQLNWLCSVYLNARLPRIYVILQFGCKPAATL